MTSSRHLAGMMMAALVPLTLAATPVEAQMNDFVDGAVTIDLGAIPGGGYGQTVISPMDSAPPSAYSGALRVPGPNRPRSSPRPRRPALCRSCASPVPNRRHRFASPPAAR